MRQSTIYLLAAVFAAAFLVGCSSIMDTKPSSGGYVELDVAMIAPDQPAVSVFHIRSADSKSVHLPTTRSLFLKPGKYLAYVNCDRPETHPDGTQEMQVSLPKETENNYSFTVESGHSYTLDCHLTDQYVEFQLFAAPAGTAPL